MRARVGSFGILVAACAVGCGGGDMFANDAAFSTDGGIVGIPDGRFDPSDAPVSDASVVDGASDFVWDLPPGFPPPPPVPADNPMSRAKVELGRHLFYDTRLSGNETFACASCHQQELAFTDGRATALGSTGASHPRGSMSIVNAVYNVTQTWAHPMMTTLEAQALVPMFGTEPVELGLRDADQLEGRLRADETYRRLFAEAFPGEAEPIHTPNVARALSAFQRTIISGRSPFDRWINQEDPNALSESARRGYALFNQEKFDCFHCHGGFDFSDHVTFDGNAFLTKPFHNTGLYNVGGRGAYPEPNTGVESVTGNARDMGAFRAPSLRNIAVTAPYMHDGSIATLDGVIDHYAAGGRTIASGPNAGVGSANPFKDPLVKQFEPTAQERADIIAFLESLTDSAFLTNPAFSNPWPPRAP